MLLSNFTINADLISISYKDKSFDLHNNYELSGIVSIDETKSISLVFSKINGDWVSVTDPSILRFEFANVKNIYHKENDQDYPSEYIAQDQGTVDMIGFSYADAEVMEGVTDNVSRPDLPALLFVMATGKAVKIIGDEVHLELG